MNQKLTAPTTTVNYLPESDPAAIEANRVYQEALRRLNESLDARKNRFFDPVLLAAAQGFLGPTKTGSGFEAIGRAAEKVGGAQEARIKEQQEEAQQRLALASAGLELERLKQRDRAISGFLGEGGPQPAGGLATAAPAAAPAGAPAAGGLPGRAEAGGGGLPASKPPGFENIPGVKTMPPNPDILTGREYIALNRFEKGASFPDLLKKANEIDSKRFEVKESGVLDARSGMFYPFPKGELVERQIDGSTYKVDSRSAAMLDFYRSTNDPRYYQLAQSIIRGPVRPQAGAPAGAPTAAAPGAEEGRGAGLVSESQKEQEKIERETRAKQLAEAAAKKEANVRENDQSARNIYSVAGRVAENVARSPNLYGIFEKPGLVSLIPKIIAEGLTTPSGTVNIAGFREAIANALPGVKQEDINRYQLVMGDLAQLELTFTRLYLQGQGAITEGERRIVGRISGGPANTPGAIIARMNLLKERAQFDMDEAQAWREYVERNPSKSYIEFERSKDYRDLVNNYEKRMAALEKRLPALPTSQRPAGGALTPEQRNRANQALDRGRP